MIKTIALLMSLGLVSSASAGNKCGDDENYPDVTKAELQELVQKKAVFLVDANSMDSYKKGHVPTAIHWGSTQAKFAQALPKDKKQLIVTYCGGKSCMAWKKPAKAACKQGYTNVKHFSAGIKGWRQKS